MNRKWKSSILGILNKNTIAIVCKNPPSQAFWDISYNPVSSFPKWVTDFVGSRAAHRKKSESDFGVVSTSGEWFELLSCVNSTAIIISIHKRIEFQRQIFQKKRVTESQLQKQSWFKMIKENISPQLLLKGTVQIQAIQAYLICPQMTLSPQLT